jgi:DNA-binding CsgD family transcriptional regulator
VEPTTKPTSQLPASLQAAQLQVVLPGSRASFRRRVMDAMRALVSAPGAFCFFGKEDARAYSDASRLVDGANAPVKVSESTKLSQAFGFEPKSLVSTLRRVYLAAELYPEAERVKLPYFRDHTVALGFTQALLLFFHEGGVLFGLAGLERREKDGEFTEENRQVIEELAPFVVAAARAQLQYEELTREAAALRALTKINGGLYVVDRDKKRVVWAADRDNGIDWEQDVVPVEEQLVSAAEVMIASKAKGEAIPPTPPTLPQGTVMAVAKIDGDPVFANARCAVVRVEATNKQPAMEGLSRREREIARLLVAGYSGVNVAAIAGLSENTVRTYVRRLYGKLGVSNRADLVRKLVSPEPASGANSSSGPSSQIAPPPDSSLVSGDDTLD